MAHFFKKYIVIVVAHDKAYLSTYERKRTKTENFAKSGQAINDNMENGLKLKICQIWSHRQ